MISPEIDRAREIVLAYGWNSTCYQILNTGFRHWFSAEGDAVVGYVEHGGYRIVGGAPVCLEERLADVVHQFESKCEQLGKHVCYFCAESRLQSLLMREEGSASVLLGAQPVWDPEEWPERVGTHASLRAQFNRARNKSVCVSEWPPEKSENHPALRRCLQEWLETRGLPPLHFLVEPDTLSLLKDRRCFVAQREGEAVAFLVASPVPRRNGWLIEQLVRGDSAVNGTAELLLDHAVRAFIEAGNHYVTLGLAPLAGRPWSDPATPLWLRGMLAWARAHGRRFYNFEGLETFKAKFDPVRWDPVYLIASERYIRIRTIRATAAAFARGSPEKLMARGLSRAVREEVRRIAS